jgi:two-component system NtrC family sensor kinase
MKFSNFILLRTKFIIFIGTIITVFYGYILYRTSTFDEAMILKQAEQQARMLYKQILLTRQWASDHNGLFILEQKGVEPNPYLDLPALTDGQGRTFYLRNPAMITRELSQYAKKDGLGFFRVTSLNPINPGNRPDPFEYEALQAFDRGAEEIIDVDITDEGKTVRFIAPLKVTYSCLGCHATHGYKEGDIRGGLSITIPINWAESLIRENIHSLTLIGVLSVLFVTVALFSMFELLIMHRVRKLSSAMDAFPEELPDKHIVPSVFRDELDVVNENFVLFCDRLKKSQEDLLKARNRAHLSEKMASLGILTAGIAHEVNNPLGGMLNCVKIMRENPGDRELVDRYLPLLDKGLRQIELIMRQLLNFGRTEPLQIRRVDLTSLINECVELLSFKLKKITVETRLEVSRDYLLDAEALKQIIINIGLNAIQAMRDGGVITIVCREIENDLVITFRDTGIGIPEQNLAHIFDPFFTTKDVGEGTGLGLAVTYSLVQRMHGNITVESVEGEGTVFTVTIPVIKPEGDQSSDVGTVNG